jgi:ketosteroid isomerase-like protein
VRRCLWFLALLLTCCAPSSLLAAAPPNTDTPVQVKTKGEPSASRDQSKPVRAALEEQYAKSVAAYHDEDPEVILALRTPDFSFQPPSGQRSSPEEAAAYIRASFEQVERTLQLTFDIQEITVQNDTAIATIHQHWRRAQLKAGQLRTVDTEAIQREWWVLTAEGWRLFFVDAVRPGIWKVDGKRVDPSRPYDPDAPPFEPAGKN